MVLPRLLQITEGLDKADLCVPSHSRGVSDLGAPVGELIEHVLKIRSGVV